MHTGNCPESRPLRFISARPTDQDPQPLLELVGSAGYRLTADSLTAHRGSVKSRAICRHPEVWEALLVFLVCEDLPWLMRQFNFRLTWPVAIFQTYIEPRLSSLPVSYGCPSPLRLSVCLPSNAICSERLSSPHYSVALPSSPPLTPLSFLHNTYFFCIIHPFMYYCLLFDPIWTS